jgi:hypothetical protein
MNRYSLIFALLVASSFAVHAPPAGEGASPAATAPASASTKAKGGVRREHAAGGGKIAGYDPVAFLQGFMNEALPGTLPGQKLKVLFATVPHPVETHLGSAFDHNIDALQDGLQEAGYLFHSSLIPWSAHTPRDAFADDVDEKLTEQLEDDSPGIMLFRKDNLANDPYANGIVVFLITEEPTAGIAYSQAKMALDILDQSKIQLSGPIRILGPTYSGSIDSLVPLVGLLLAKNPGADVLIRSGGVTAGVEAVAAARRIAGKWPQAKIDFGSAHRDYSDGIRAAVLVLNRMAIDRAHTAILSEGESLFGGLYEHHCEAETPGYCTWRDSKLAEIVGMWSLYFPRDISSLRAGYEQQGIFDTSPPTQPWKRFLNLKSDEQGEGDSVRSFGGPGTIAAQESVLFGISDFLKAHGIRAVIVSATNEEDRYFLTQFLHAHNGGVRVVVVGSTRLFMRGSTSQFRGDLIVDEFPMLPRLRDWTAGPSDLPARTFADDEAEGTYYAAVDMFKEWQLRTKRYQWFPEYSEPDWTGNGARAQRPPMYVAALGGNSAWPVSEDAGAQLTQDGSDRFRAELPFTLFKHNLPAMSEDAPHSGLIHLGRSWVDLFLGMIAVTAAYYICIWYANRVSRIACASFSPVSDWRFWFFKVTVPASIAGSIFRVLAWAAEMPAAASPDAVFWWHIAEALTVLAPLAIAAAALTKAMGPVGLPWDAWMSLTLLPAAVFAIALFPAGFFQSDPFASWDAGSVLNSYREMHWESELSLLPTAVLLLFAIGVWANQAGAGAALLRAVPPLPHFPGNSRISARQGKLIASIGRPLPSFRRAKWLWIAWAAVCVSIAIVHFNFPAIRQLTTLETYRTTRLVVGLSGFVVALMLFDLLQFLWLWDSLQTLLHALGREHFKRSFVPIEDFNWKSLWSFNGISFRDHRAIYSAQIDCVLDLAGKHGVAGLAPFAAALADKRIFYNTVDLDSVKQAQFDRDNRLLFKILARTGTVLTQCLAAEGFAQPEPKISPSAEALQRAIASSRSGEGRRFGDEAEELARTPERQQTAERLLCLLYIGFIQTIVARLHSLLVSVAMMFSLDVLGIAIYPFVPFSPLMLIGIALLLAIGWAFFKIFSEMDRDPILSRVVNGDDRKLEGNFYAKFAESLALPLLTLGSTFLPGGAGRLLELAQTFFNHGQ